MKEYKRALIVCITASRITSVGIDSLNDKPYINVETSDGEGATIQLTYDQFYSQKPRIGHYYVNPSNGLPYITENLRNVGDELTLETAKAVHALIKADVVDRLLSDSTD